MAEQTSGRHLNQQASDRQADRPARTGENGTQRSRPAARQTSGAVRPVNTARTAENSGSGRPAQPTNTARNASGARPANPARSASGARPANPARSASGARPANPARSASGSRPVNGNGTRPVNGRARQGGQAVPPRQARSGGPDRTGGARRGGGPAGPSGPERPGGKKQGPSGDLILRYAVLAALFVSMVVFAVMLGMTKMLSGKYLVIICILLLVILGVVAALLLVFGRRRRPWAGIAVAGVMAVIMIIGSVAAARGIKTLQSITSPEFSVSHIGIYVKNDDPAQSLDDMGSYTFGIMDTMGREYVDKAIENINELLPAPISVVEYASPTQMVDALFDGSVGAVITDVSYIEGLNELDEYKETVSMMREITDMSVEIKIEPSPTPAVEETAEKHVYTALISGIDSRNGLVRSSLSDVNILVTVNTETHQVLMISTPRDFFVPFSNTGNRDKLTHAGWYGIDVCMDTIGDLYGVDIDYYFRVNFEGFVNIIDALGGVTVDSEKSFTAGGYSFSSGPNTLNGTQALVFARERKSFAEGDRQRGKNQMAVIRAVINKALSPELLTNYNSLLKAVEGSFEMTVPYDLIAATVRDQLDTGAAWNIVSYSVTGTDTYATSPLLGMSVYVMEPDTTTVDTAKGLIDQVMNDQTVTAP